MGTSCTIYDDKFYARAQNGGGGVVVQTNKSQNDTGSNTLSAESALAVPLSHNLVELLLYKHTASQILL